MSGFCSRRFVRFGRTGGSECDRRCAWRVFGGIGAASSGTLSCLEAAEFLGISERHFRRLRERYEAEGAEGLIDRRRGRASGRRVPVDRIEWVLSSTGPATSTSRSSTSTRPCRPSTASSWSYTWTKTRAAGGGLVRVAPQALGASQEAAAPAAAGHAAVPGRLALRMAAGRPPLDLIVTLDDATSEIYSVFLVEQEGTASSFRGLDRDDRRARGCSRSLYTDRGSHYFHTPKAGGKVAQEPLTQVGRALGAARDRAHPVLPPGGAGPHGAAVRHASEPPAAGARAGRDRHDRGGQPLPRRGYMAEHNARFAVAAGRGGRRLRALRRRSRRHPLRPGASASSATTTACATTGRACRSRRSGIAATSSRPGCASTNTRTAGSPSSTARAASPDTAPTAPCIEENQTRQPLKPARRPACGLVDNAAALPTAPTGQQQQQRTFDVLRKPDIFTCYRHPRAKDFRVRARNILQNILHTHNRAAITALIMGQFGGERLGV